MRDRIRRIKELIRHKKSFYKIEGEVFGRHTWRGITHDLDKLIMYLLPLRTNFIREYHKEHAKHHNPDTLLDYYERLVDIECARFTKRRSSLTARNFLLERKKISNNPKYDVMLWLADLYNLK